MSCAIKDGPNAVDLTTFSYDNPAQPAQTLVTDPLGKVSTYDIARDTASNVPKITRMSGDCPSCGTGPNAQYTYGDVANPLLYTQVVDGRGLITQYAYDSLHRVSAQRGRWKIAWEDIDTADWKPVKGTKIDEIEQGSEEP